MYPIDSTLLLLIFDLNNLLIRHFQRLLHDGETLIELLLRDAQRRDDEDHASHVVRHNEGEQSVLP